MPSPLGHAMAGVIVAWSSEHLPSPFRPAVRLSAPLVMACVLVALAPDLDLLSQPLHRTGSHSLVAVALMTIVAAAVTRWVTGRVDWRIAALCGAAYGSHVLLDWMGEDFYAPRGVQLLWPFSDTWFISEWDLFRRTQRSNPLSLLTMTHNLWTAAQEIVILGPILLILWMAQRPHA